VNTRGDIYTHKNSLCDVKTDFVHGSWHSVWENGKWGVQKFIIRTQQELKTYMGTEATRWLTGTETRQEEEARVSVGAGEEYQYQEGAEQREQERSRLGAHLAVNAARETPVGADCACTFSTCRWRLCLAVPC
jgi:hypothetical protein